MKAATLRMALAVLLLATVVSKVYTPRLDDRDLDPGVFATVAHYGLTPRRGPAEAGSALFPAISFEAPGCSGAVQVVPIKLNLQEAPLLGSVGGPGYVRHFIYLGRTWHNLDRLGMRLEWLKHKSLSVLGLSPYAPTSSALMVAEPRGCHAAEAIDWSRVWRSGSAHERAPAATSEATVRRRQMAQRHD